jgi:hypothetical protein
MLIISHSYCSPSRTIFGYSHSVSRAILFNSSLHLAWGRPTLRLPRPLPLQRANTECYVSDFSFLSDHLVSDSTTQRNLEHSSFHSSLSALKLVDQPCCECPRQTDMVFHTNVSTQRGSNTRPLESNRSTIPVVVRHRCEIMYDKIYVLSHLVFGIKLKNTTSLFPPWMS